MTYTDNLTISVSAAALTDPNDARRLASCLGVIVKHEHQAGELVHVRFLGSLIDSLHHYADELERAHDEVVREVSEYWFGEED